MAGQKLTIYMEPDIIKELKKAAIDEEKSLSKLLSELAIEYLKSKKS